ncbi:hypothetical protein HUO13_24395 [Saccharopolyspora erythraea]|uniref:hypothetical protein n=1 Tax=Saccharopolyspora erythraea TaxID=1836 RepID=UPI001BAA2F95|nr:hypothetical protein [Saccharopolyspora erythraea]QUH03538.1 hypothetical protein HUO13_24395 [Saccharopolyspora erythraea]
MERQDQPLDLGETELPAGEERQARREHDADAPRTFDERNDIPERAAHRARLLPEEEAAGSADPEAQAREVLRDSDLRTELPESAPDTFIERRSSDETAT